MFYDNKVDVKKEVIYYDVWVTYFGFSLHIVVPKKPLREGKGYMGVSKLYIATDEDGSIHVGGNSPCICTNYDHKFWSGFNGFSKKLGHTGGCLPVCWKDSLVEYKLY
jgi:hypothetical protein